MTAHDRPARARRPRGRLIALLLAIAVNLLFVGVLVFSVTWQNREPAAVTAELYAPPSADLTPLPATKLPELPPPRPLPAPPQLPPVPAPAPAPTPAPPPQTPSQADIELKAKQEAAKKEEAKKEAEQKARQEAKRQAEQQARALAAMQAQAQHELQKRQDAERDARLRKEAEAESRLRAQAEQEAQARAQQAAAATARSRAEADWIDRIRSKIRSNVNLPPEISGNPEAIFDVVQLPTGEVLSVKMTKSSGIPAYDDAVQRAIMKSSPLPPPPSPDLFQRELVLHFRPHEQ
ncbi:MAG TPA: cell envelope integrity protein TolA [Casimicrobiaceae bacterium]